MALKWGSTTISSDYDVTFNGNEVKKIYWNSTLVWEKAESAACYNCGDVKYIYSTCYNCYSVGNGQCANCRGNGLARSTLCSSCLGLSASYYCNGCGAIIYVSSFKKTGTTSTVDYSKSYTCGRCRAYYTNLYDVHDSCQLLACVNDVSAYGYSVGACDGGYKLDTCDICGGDGNCTQCNGSGEVVTPCPVCNGGSSGGGGDTSSD